MEEKLRATVDWELFDRLADPYYDQPKEGEFTALQIKERRGISRRSANRLLSKMEQDGLMTRRVVGFMTYWKFTGKQT